MRHLLICAIASLLLALPASRTAQAEEIVMGLSQSSIAITTNFDGSDILIFGAIKREDAIPESDLHVIVTVSGPSKPLTVWRKERRYGIWINTEGVPVDRAPSFYAVASSAPLDEVLSQTDDLRHRISVPLAIRAVGAPETITDAQRFSDALIRIRTENELYSALENGVELQQQTLFRTSISLPASLQEGDYTARIFLTRQKEVIAEFSTVIDVRKVGLERFMYMLAHGQPVLYGLLSLMLAAIGGWGASAFFRIVLRQG